MYISVHNSALLVLSTAFCHREEIRQHSNRGKHIANTRKRFISTKMLFLEGVQSAVDVPL
jgi:hypothetical protein